MEGLEDVKKELEAKRQALSLELESAMGQVAALENDLQRVDDALRALTKKGKGRSRSRKSSPHAEEDQSSLHADAAQASGGTFYSAAADPFDPRRFG
jgi:peptidoglycan hydrolase CwlO-like protein